MRQACMLSSSSSSRSQLAPQRRYTTIPPSPMREVCVDESSAASTRTTRSRSSQQPDANMVSCAVECGALWVSLWRRSYSVAIALLPLVLALYYPGLYEWPMPVQHKRCN